MPSLPQFQTLFPNDVSKHNKSINSGCCPNKIKHPILATEHSTIITSVDFVCSFSTTSMYVKTIFFRNLAGPTSQASLHCKLFMDNTWKRFPAHFPHQKHNYLSWYVWAELICDYWKAPSKGYEKLHSATAAWRRHNVPHSLIPTLPYTTV